MKRKLLSLETKRKISQSLSGHFVSKETRQKLSLAHSGKKQSKETIEKRASKLRGRKRPSFSKSWIERMSLAQKGKKLSLETRKKLSLIRKGKKRTGKILFGVLNPAWNGDKANYHQIHKWINKHWGRPKKCEYCGTIKAKRYEWASISRRCKRSDRNDWIRLCISCHIKYDRYKSIDVIKWLKT